MLLLFLSFCALLGRQTLVEAATADACFSFNHTIRTNGGSPPPDRFELIPALAVLDQEAKAFLNQEIAKANVDVSVLNFTSSLLIVTSQAACASNANNDVLPRCAAATTKVCVRADEVIHVRLIEKLGLSKVRFFLRNFNLKYINRIEADYESPLPVRATLALQLLGATEMMGAVDTFRLELGLFKKLAPLLAEGTTSAEVAFLLTKVKVVVQKIIHKQGISSTPQRRRRQQSIGNVGGNNNVEDLGDVNVPDDINEGLNNGGQDIGGGGNAGGGGGGGGVTTDPQQQQTQTEVIGNQVEVVLEGECGGQTVCTSENFDQVVEEEVAKQVENGELLDDLQELPVSEEDLPDEIPEDLAEEFANLDLDNLDLDNYFDLITDMFLSDTGSVLDINVTALIENVVADIPPTPRVKQESVSEPEVPWWIWLLVGGCVTILAAGALWTANAITHRDKQAHIRTAFDQHQEQEGKSQTKGVDEDDDAPTSEEPEQYPATAPQERDGPTPVSALGDDGDEIDQVHDRTADENHVPAVPLPVVAPSMYAAGDQHAGGESNVSIFKDDN